MVFNPFPNNIFSFSKLKKSLRTTISDENGRKFYKRVENTCYKQFLLFWLCFQKTCTADMLKPGLVWERVNVVFSLFQIYHSEPIHLFLKFLELFPKQALVRVCSTSLMKTLLYTHSENCAIFIKFKIVSENSFSLEES